MGKRDDPPRCAVARPRLSIIVQMTGMTAESVVYSCFLCYYTNTRPNIFQDAFELADRQNVCIQDNVSWRRQPPWSM